MLFKTALCVLSLCAMLTACSSDDEQTPNNIVPEDTVPTDTTPKDSVPNDTTPKVRQLIIAEVPITRATLTDNTTTLGAAWKAGDKATCLNLTKLKLQTLLYNELTASSSAVTSAFTGSVTECGKSDKLALIYPHFTPATGNGSFTINLSGQKGTLDYIQENLHYVYGVATVESVTNNTTTATISEMKSLLCVCKFKFKEKDTNDDIPVKTLTISYGNDETAGLPLTYTVVPKTDPAEVVSIPANLSPDPEKPKPLIIDLGTGVETTDGIYVALFPITDQKLFFSLTNKDGTYTGTATAKLKAGSYYSVTLTLVKISI